ncbi:lipid-A-disaccharide kinase [Tangfeifania diversioriginum]|uniref:Tetraacyldisaccharide 4'-kinase n=1 Tax=Tangfeifania diversioriginum TaxID=1168035 RepID=A0A1M6HEQ7_9BACT|nr:tetraacyldisaccharide 4'-kinase [Tangfeifania diversioriginum]SHJ20636.1 lipid-A-disaccharide kinase [Tangfeifania diversioriginum]
MVKLLLYPFSFLYGVAVYIRNRLYDLNILKSKEFDISVISIGNITVGGTGKTPHVEYLIGLLKDNFTVATLSRGYKRKTKGFMQVEAETPFSDVGDEPLQVKKKFPDISVSVCENRVAGVEKLLQDDDETSPDVILLDDAYQHRRITPGLNILLIDYNRQINEDMLLPAGRLRESARQMRRANIIIFTKCPGEITPIMRRILTKTIGLKPYQELFFTTFEYDKIKPVFSGTELKTDFYDQKSYSILIVTGIAFPRLIPEYLKQFSDTTEIISFPDHHNYSKNDIDTIMRKFESLPGDKKIIITTEKDAVRFSGMTDLDEQLKEVLYYLPVKVRFLENEGKMFNKKILNYVGENKSNRELHKRKNKRPA